MQTPSRISACLMAAALTACTPVPSLHLDSMTPRDCTAVGPDSMLRASLRYRIPKFSPGQWLVIAVFQSATSGVTLGGSVDTVKAGEQPRMPGELPDSAGVYHLIEPFSSVWANSNIARPFRVFFLLNQTTAPNSSHAVVKLGPYTYPIGASRP